MDYDIARPAHSSPDAGLREDLAVFAGPNSEPFIRNHDRRQASSKRLVLSWNWPAFLLTYAWFFYRKMYWLGAALFVLPIALVVADLGAAIISLTLAFALLANTLYVDHGLKHVAHSRSLGLDEEQRVQYLKNAGGVSRTAGAVAGAVVLFQYISAAVTVYDAFQRPGPG